MQADVTVYVEDFEDEQGNAEFDPLFDHEFSREEGEPNWGFVETLPFSDPPGHMLLGLYGTKDTISFNLSEEQSVFFASVDVSDGGGNSTVLFIGNDGEASFQCQTASKFFTFEATNAEIGFIRAIVLFSYEGFFDNIEIRVVPEADCLFNLVAMFLGFVALLRRFKCRHYQ